MKTPLEVINRAIELVAQQDGKTGFCVDCVATAIIKASESDEEGDPALRAVVEAHNISRVRGPVGGNTPFWRIARWYDRLNAKPGQDLGEAPWSQPLTLRLLTEARERLSA